MYVHCTRKDEEPIYNVTMYLNIPRITHGHSKGWDVIVDIQEVDPEAADCGSHLWPKTSLVISNHCQLHTQKLEGLAFMHAKPLQSLEPD